MPITTALDQFRLELGDIDADHPLLNDDEAAYFIDARPDSILLAVADACDALARRFATDFDFETDGQKFSRSQKAKAFKELAADCRKRAAVAAGLGVLTTTRVDGYSQEASTRDVAGAGSAMGRTRRGYFDDDLPA